MADVDITPQEPEPLKTAGDEEDAPGDAENSQNDVTGDVKTDSVRELNGLTRNSPEGQKESGEDGESLAAKRPSPEGAQVESPVDKGDDHTAAATTNDNATSGETTTEPQTSGDDPPKLEGGEESHGEDSGRKEVPAEDSATHQLGREEAADSRDVQGQRDAAEASDRTEEGDGAEGTETARDASDVHQPPPSTPTFDSDRERDSHGDTNRGTDGDDTDRGKAAESLDEDARAAAEEMADEAHALASVASPTGAMANKRLTNTPLGGAGPALKPTTAQLPPVARGQVRGQQMTSAISDALQHGSRPSPKQLIRSRRPPKYIRLATVTVSPAKARPLPHGPSLYYEEPKRPKKVITWDEATNARPPLRIDMEGPTACTYTPRVKPLNETNAPSFTFGSKCFPEKQGGARTSWSKTWFQTPHVWHTKVDFSRDALWPSPNHYPKGSGIGPRQRTMPEAPSFTFGHKPAYSIARPDAPKEPSPNEYKRQNADKLVLPRGPSFTHQLRREGTMLWGAREVTPGPAAYSPSKPSPERPSFTIQGIRREKSHILGPYSSL